MGWDQFAPTMMKVLGDIDRQPLEDAQIRHMGAMDQHMAAQNVHLAESDRLLGAWHDIQKELRQQQIDINRQQAETMARFKTASIESTKLRGANQIAKNVVEPWKQLIKTDSPEYNHFATKYLGRLQHAARNLAAGIVDQDQYAEENGEAELTSIQEELLNDPALQRFAQAAGQIMAEKGRGSGLSFDQRLMLGMAPAALQAWAGQNRQLPLAGEVPGLQIGSPYNNDLMQMMKLIIDSVRGDRSYPGAGASPGAVPRGGYPTAPPATPAPGPASPGGNMSPMGVPGLPYYNQKPASGPFGAAGGDMNQRLAALYPDGQTPNIGVAPVPPIPGPLPPKQTIGAHVQGLLDDPDDEVMNRYNIADLVRMMKLANQGR